MNKLIKLLMLLQSKKAAQKIPKRHIIFLHRKGPRRLCSDNGTTQQNFTQFFFDESVFDEWKMEHFWFWHVFRCFAKLNSTYMFCELDQKTFSAIYSTGMPKHVGTSKKCKTVDRTEYARNNQQSIVNQQ